MSAPRNLAQLKRAVTVGTRLQCLHHWSDERHPDRAPLGGGAVRTVTKVQGNGYYCTVPGHEERWWSDWPKAAWITWHDDGSWTQTFGDPGRTVTLRLLEEEA